MVSEGWEIIASEIIMGDVGYRRIGDILWEMGNRRFVMGIVGNRKWGRGKWEFGD